LRGAGTGGGGYRVIPPKKKIIRTTQKKENKVSKESLGKKTLLIQRGQKSDILPVKKKKR